MEWIEFLSDPELNTQSAPFGPPNGRYLCKKVFHDTLECLNTYKECANILSTQQDALSAQTHLWFTKWALLVERWISEINFLSKRCEQLSTESPAWPNIIAQIGEIVNQAPVLEIESQVLEIPATGLGRQTTQIAIHAIKKLNLLRHDIQAREYKRLWTIVSITAQG
jgi:hypothetical protein